MTVWRHKCKKNVGEKIKENVESVEKIENV